MVLHLIFIGFAASPALTEVIMTDIFLLDDACQDY